MGTERNVAKVWHGAYWKSRKNSPWVVGALVVGALWAYGHTSNATGGDSAKHGARPSASASAKPGTAKARHGSP